MADHLDPASRLAGSLVRIVTGHVISSTAMVSRAYLADSWLGVVVKGADESLWLASTLDALAPDANGLAARGAANGGPPVEHSSPRLVKVTMSWGDMAGRSEPGGEADIANPNVVVHPGGSSVGVIALRQVRALSAAIAAGTGPIPIPVGDGVHDENTVTVLTPVSGPDGSLWPVARPARVVSDRSGGFFDEAGALAIDLQIEESHSGAPAFVGDSLCGVVRPIAPDLSLLISTEIIAETIAHAHEPGGGSQV